MWRRPGGQPDPSRQPKEIEVRTGRPAAVYQALLWAPHVRGLNRLLHSVHLLLRLHTRPAECNRRKCVGM